MAETESKPQTGVSNGTHKKSDTRIVRQLEFYFGDCNQLRDNFMIEERKKDDGWFSIETLLKFKRLASLSSDPEHILKEASDSKSDVFEVDMEKKRIRRTPSRPLPASLKEFFNKCADRTLYVKGFAKSCTHDDVEEFFDKYEYPLESFHLRKIGGTFKTSIFATMKTKEKADHFIKEGPTKYNDDCPDLVKMLKSDYLDKKLQEKRDSAVKKGEEKDKQAAAAVKEDKEKLIESMEKAVVKGAVLVCDGLECEDYVSHQAIKEFFKKLGHTLSYLEVSEDKKSAKMRFTAENEGKLAWETAVKAVDEKCEKPFEAKIEIPTLGKSVAFVKVLEGEEEDLYWKATIAARAENWSNQKKRGFQGGHRGGGRGGRGRGGRGRGGGFRGVKRSRDGPSDGEPQTKVSKA